MTRPVERVINGDAFLLVPEFAYAEAVGRDWEAPLYARFKEAVGAGATVFDVGASFGLYAIAAARCAGPSGRVLAFEPARRTAAALRSHLDWNRVADRVEVVEAVVADQTGEAIFWEQETSFVASLVERAAREEAGSFATPVERTRVPAVTLDDVCAARGLDPDVVKVDVEGGEARVLEGAGDLLARRRATLFLELHDDLAAPGAGSADDVLRALGGAGWCWDEVDVRAATRHMVCTPA